MREKKKGLTKEAIKEFNESRKGLEVDLMDEVLKSRRTAWMVATGSAVVTVFALSLVEQLCSKEMMLKLQKELLLEP